MKKEQIQYMINSVSAAGVGSVEEVKLKGKCLVWLASRLTKKLKEQEKGDEPSDTDKQPA